jgi:hypothetical protein
LEGRTNISDRVFNSRRQLIPIFDKPAFSRISLHSEPRIVGLNIWEIREKAGLSKMGMSCRRLVFKALFTYVSTSFGRLTIEKCFENMVRNVCSDFQNLRLGGVKLLQKIVASERNQRITSHVATIFCNHQTKMLEGGTKDEMRILAALFNGHCPKLSTHALEKCFLRNPHFAFCSSFQHLRLGSMKLLPVWRTKKSHFQPSVEMGRKNVDKNIDKHNKQ